MEPSGSLFPSLVVAGHVVTLAAVWHWRKGHRQALDEQGKHPCLCHCHGPPPLTGARGGAGGGGSAFLPPLAFCALLFLFLSEIPVFVESHCLPCAISLFSASKTPPLVGACWGRTLWLASLRQALSR